MKILKASTKAGQRVLAMRSRCCWNSLYNIYDSWSEAKQKAFDWCYEQFCNDEDSEAFGIGNANSFGFTASWLLTYEGEDALRVETKDNSYIVLLDR